MQILWDFDGTLFDTYPSLVDGFIQLSGKELDREEVLMWLKKDSKTAFKHYGIDESKREEYTRLNSVSAMKTSVPFSHLENVLSQVEGNIIVTHRDKQSTIQLLDKYGLRKYFKEIIAVEEEGFARKPDRASYEHVLKSHPIDLVVGDRDLDLIPARQLNIKTVAFQNRNIEADFHLDTYEDFIPNVLEALTK